MIFDLKTTVVLTLDLQNGIIAMVQAGDECLANASRIVKGARHAGLRVMHVGLGFSEGYPEVSPANSRFSSLRESGRLKKGSQETEFDSRVFEKGETTITKYRVSAFAGSTLQTILRAQNIKTLVLFGLATSGIVLSTVREAADLDYQLFVIKDASGDRDPEVHRVLTEKVFPNQATVLTTHEFLEKLK